ARAELDLCRTLTGWKFDGRARNWREPAIAAHAKAGDVGLATRVHERDRLIRHVHEIAMRRDAERGHAARGEGRAGGGRQACPVHREHGDAVTARIDGQYVPAAAAPRPPGTEIAP